MKTKFIFVTGGVISSVGKGVISSSVGSILKSCGYKVFLQKFDPYLNVYPGTINPLQHGEIFVTKDGKETDLDLGHYERFLNQSLNSKSNVTAGQIFKEIISNEEKGDYLGHTIQYVPHVTDLIKDKIKKILEQEDYDFVITEIGGTVGDIELQAFLEGIRRFKNDNFDDVCNIHVSYTPYLEIIKEYKTKPFQNSLIQQKMTGVIPDIFIIRSEGKLRAKYIDKINNFAGVSRNCIINMPNIDFKYYCPLYLIEQGIHERIFDLFKLEKKIPNETNWRSLLKKYNSVKGVPIEIAIVGKYTLSKEAYISIFESLNFASWEIGRKINISLINSSEVNNQNVNEKFSNIDCIIVPGGFDKRGTTGKIETIKYARENKVPFLGICLGFQLAIIEFMRNVCGVKSASSEEFSDNSTLNKNVISLIKGKSKNNDFGGTMRLGEYRCEIIKNTLAAKIYNKESIYERHRQRYEFNNSFLKYFNKTAGLFSGYNSEYGSYEIFEIKNNGFFIATQFHPEYKSRPNKPHPLFKNLLLFAVNKN